MFKVNISHKPILFVVFIFMISISNNGFSNQNSIIAENWKNYNSDYKRLDQKCMKVITATEMYLMDLADCVWRKDQILLKKYNFDPILFSLASKRYKDIFSSAKSSAVLLVKRYNDNVLTNHIKNSRDISSDTFEMVRFKLIEYIKK